MNTMTETELQDITGLIDYELIRRYAVRLARRRSITAGDAEDIAHDAWLDAQRRATCVLVKDDAAALARRICYTAVADALRKYRNWIGYDSSFDESDHLTAAERMYLEADSWEDPFWLRLFEAQKKQLSRDAGKRPTLKLALIVVRALLKDSRLAVARAEANVSFPTLRTILEILKARFDLCYQALRAYRALQRTFTFPSDNRLCKCGAR